MAKACWLAVRVLGPWQRPHCRAQNNRNLISCFRARGRLGFDPWVWKSPWRRKSYPLKYSGLENSMDCIVHGVTKIQTQLSDWTTITTLITSSLIPLGLLSSFFFFFNVWRWKSFISVQLFVTPWTVVHGILQARILDWVTFHFSRESSQPRDRNHVSHIAGGFFSSWATREAQMKVKVSQSCLTLCNPMDYTVYWVLQARILEWVTFSLLPQIFPTQESNRGLLHCKQILYQLSYQGSPFLCLVTSGIFSAVYLLPPSTCLPTHRHTDTHSVQP